MAAQFPHWAGLPVERVEIDGWDNTTFRLGEELSIRLPSHQAYVPQVEKEQRWLPVLAAGLPLRVPEPVALGAPSDEFPRPWSIRRWLPGETLSPDRVASMTSLAAALAGFLSALQAIAASEGPPAGPHSFFRGGPLETYDAETREATALLGGELDARAVTDAWEAALASRWSRPPVWVHGDVAPSNLLLEDGRLAAVLDFGCAAVGDPACDLVMAWTFFAGESRDAFRQTLALDDASWARARGWALWKALITLAQDRRGGVAAEKAARRVGWRVGARETIGIVLAEAGRSPRAEG